MQRTISYSSIERFRDCAYKYYLSKIANCLPVKTSTALNVGKMFHKAHEQPSLFDAITMLNAEYQAATTDNINSVLLVDTMISSTYKHLKPLGCTERELELTVKIPGKRGFNYFGIIDGILKDGRTYEIKTTSNTVDKEAEIQRHSIQNPLYWVLSGINEGTVVDIIKKPTVRQKKNETIDEYFDRCTEQYDSEPDRFFKRIELPYEEIKHKAAVSYLQTAIDDIRACINRNDFPRRYGHACKTPWGNFCDYQSLCWYNNIGNYKIGEQRT